MHSRPQHPAEPHRPRQPCRMPRDVVPLCAYENGAHLFACTARSRNQISVFDRVTEVLPVPLSRRWQAQFFFHAQLRLESKIINHNTVFETGPTTPVHAGRVLY